MPKWKLCDEVMREAAKLDGIARVIGDTLLPAVADGNAQEEC